METVAALSRSKYYSFLFVLVIFLLLLSCSSKPPINLKGISSVPIRGAKAQKLLKISWGKGDRQLGKSEQLPRPGPMSFSVFGDSVYILDQVNDRVLKFKLSKDMVSSFGIKDKAYNDIKVDAGCVYLIDAADSLSIDVYSNESLVKTLKIDGELEPITGFQLNGNLIYVESNHSFVTEVGRKDNQRVVASSSGKIYGRLTPDSKLAVATFKKKAFLTIDGKRLSFSGNDLQAIVDLMFDRQDIYLLLGMGNEKSEGSRQPYFSLVKVKKGEVIWQMLLPDKGITDQYRKIDVYNGSVYQMQTRQKGIELLRWK